MAYLYLTREYKAKEAAYSPIVQPHLKTIQGIEDPKPLLDRFGALPIFKKQADNLRIILQEVTCNVQANNYNVFCVRMVLPRGSNEYDTFHWAPKVKNWLENNPLSPNEISEIEAWLKEELEKERKSRELPELPEELKSWLGLSSVYLSNSTIYETQEWTESIKEKGTYDFKETICKSILNLQSNIPIDPVWEKEGDRNICLSSFEHQIYILFEKVNFENENPILILYKIFKGEKPNESELEQVLKNYLYPTADVNKERLIRDAKRAYPDYILIEPQLWFRIQEDSVANLALSPEEESLLQSATFPMFINGQAGSGKSTMLFYLFSHFCSLHKDGDFNPLFLTYNRRLLDTARKSVSSILKNHPNYSELEIDLKKVETFFHPFQDFILNNLVAENDKHVFSKEKYISFSKFKQCFLGIYTQKSLNCQLPNKKKYSPELVWHIIRTYIKGYDFENDFTIGNYEGLAKKDRSVSNEKYADVFNTIWNNWYSKFNSDFRLWDDQDLIRYVLKNIKLENFPQFPVIFCDEAQDFTKIEIELLLRLSAFTKYNLSHHSNIPFSFAGDPYQTINPTGFRWETLKTIFNERFEKLNPKGLSIRFEPLSQNYRSKPAIIKFTNLIQGFRYKYLQIQELRPQSAWQKLEGVTPCIFILDQDIKIENLKVVADKTIILIPTDADENQEFDYVRNDSILSSFIQLPDNEDTPISNVMSASTSKGLEFDRVVLYNFGNAISKTFQKAIEGNELNDSEFIELSHFCNKLYVAISRARNYLFIIDNEEGYKNFWEYFMKTDFLISEFEKGNYWTENEVSPLIRGLKEDIDNIKEENPLKVAKELEESGREQGNYSLLQRAQQYYKLEGKDTDALRCEAWAFWFKENWEKAGNSFSQLGETNQASKAFWRGQNWQSIKELFESKDVNVLQLEVADYMLGNKELSSFFPNEKFIEECDINNETWKAVILKVQKEFEGNNSTTDYSNYAVFAQKIANKGFKQFYNFSGNLYFKDKSYENAVKCWDRNENKEHNDYYNAKLELSQEVNDKLFWMQKLKQDDKIVALYNTSGLTIESHNIIFGALIRRNEFDKSISYEGITLQAKVKRLLENFNSSEQKQKIFDFLLKNEEEGLKILKDNIKTFQDFFANKDAIRLILKRENWKDLLDELDKELRSALPGKFIESFVDVICEEIDNKNVERISYAINLVGELNKRDDKLTENIKIIKAIAYSEVTPELFSFNLRERLEAFVTKCVWEKTGWRGDMNFKEIGTALERLGAKSITLQDEIYDYIIKYEPEFSDWAKARWIKVAQRRIEYEKNQKRLGFVKKIEDDIKGKIDEWKLNLSLIDDEPEFPVLKEKENIPFIFKNLKIYGLPENPKTEENKNKVIIALLTYEIRINCNSKLVSVEECETGRTIDIDVSKKEIGGLGVSRKGDEFTCENKFSGSFDKTNSLKLYINDFNLTIVIE